MSLETEVQKALTEAGEKLKKDLWSPSDIVVLAQRARDLVGLELKAKVATDPNKKAQYKLGAKLIMDHVQLLALTRMSVAEKHIQEAIGNAFIGGLQSALSSLLPNVH
jgi:hypothetical protein